MAVVARVRRWVRGRWFKSSAMILFLNKRDLFADKIRKVDIRNDGSDGSAPRFLDYRGAVRTRVAVAVAVPVAVCICVRSPAGTVDMVLALVLSWPSLFLFLLFVLHFVVVVVIVVVVVVVAVVVVVCAHVADSV